MGVNDDRLPIEPREALADSSVETLLKMCELLGHQRFGDKFALNIQFNAAERFCSVETLVPDTESDEDAWTMVNYCSGDTLKRVLVDLAAALLSGPSD